MSGVKAAPGSLLDQFRARRAEKFASLKLDHEVPHTDAGDGLGSVWLRFRPIEDKQANRVTKKHDKAKDEEKNLRRNAAVIGEFCTAIYRLLDGREVSVDPEDPDGTPPTFATIAADAGVNVVEVVRQVFVTDGSIHSCAALLTEWSDYRRAEEAESDQGE